MARITNSEKLASAIEQCEAIASAAQAAIDRLPDNFDGRQTLLNSLISIRGMARHVVDGGSVVYGSPVPYQSTYTALGQ